MIKTPLESPAGAGLEEAPWRRRHFDSKNFCGISGINFQYGTFKTLYNTSTEDTTLLLRRFDLQSRKLIAFSVFNQYFFD